MASSRRTNVEPTVADPVIDPKLVEENTTLKSRLAEFEAAEAQRASAKAKADEEAALKRGEAEKLYGDAKTRAEAAEAVIKERDAKLAEYAAADEKRAKALDDRNAAKVKEIPEARRTLVPAILKGEDLADYLDTNWPLLTGADPEPKAAGTRRPTVITTPDSKTIPPEIVAEAAYHQQDPAVWWKRIQRTQPARAKQLIEQGVN